MSLVMNFWFLVVEYGIILMDMTDKIKCIIGLGNPDKKYERTYHNVGSMFIDYWINKDRTITKNQKSKNFEYTKTDSLIFIKPLTFMNESGGAVKSALKYFGFEPGETLVVHDDSDIELGNFKFSFGRGSAGHKGIESIIRNLKTKNFWRLRIGIRPPKNDGPIDAKRRKAAEFVLKKISETGQKAIEFVFEKALNAYTNKAASDL